MVSQIQAYNDTLKKTIQDHFMYQLTITGSTTGLPRIWYSMGFIIF